MHAAFSTIREDYIQMPPHRSDRINSDLSILSCGGCLALGIIITIPHLSYPPALPHLENCSNTAYVLTDCLYFCLLIYLPIYLLHKLAYYSTIIALLLASPHIFLLQFISSWAVVTRRFVWQTESLKASFSLLLSSVKHRVLVPISVSLCLGSVSK